MRALPEEFTIRESDKDGLGLFARQEIIFFPTAVCHIHHPYLGWLRTAVGAFLNHSDTPTCVIQESEVIVKTDGAIADFQLDRYLLGTKDNHRTGIIVKIRCLLQCAKITAGDEITVAYEDINHHGIRYLGDTGLLTPSQEEGQAQKNYSTRLVASKRQVESVG
jgi:hypothetical protein